MSTSPVYGTRTDATKTHPVLDLDHWINIAAVGSARRTVGWVDGPVDLAIVEQARRLVEVEHDLGPSVNTDVFTWSSMGHDDDTPWLTRIGGTPWRPADRPWPRDDRGNHQHFLGQISFVDSQDILPFELPGDVLLIFGRWDSGWVQPAVDGYVIEWSPRKIKQPLAYAGDVFAELPFEWHGVIHRTRQFLDHEVYDDAYRTHGWEHGGFQIANCQATLIGPYADLPQGWPFEDGDGNTVIACLSSMYFSNSWPLCNVESGSAQHIRPDGSRFALRNSSLNFGIGDAGCIWVYRAADGGFKAASAYG